MHRKLCASTASSCPHQAAPCADGTHPLRLPGKIAIRQLAPPECRASQKNCLPGRKRRPHNLRQRMPDIPRVKTPFSCKEPLFERKDAKSPLRTSASDRLEPSFPPSPNLRRNQIYHRNRQLRAPRAGENRANRSGSQAKGFRCRTARISFWNSPQIRGKCRTTSTSPTTASSSE